MAGRREWTDAELLEVLDLRDQGVTAARIADRFGVSRSAVLGLVHRLKVETDQCFPPCAADGTLAADWWRAGLVSWMENGTSGFDNCAWYLFGRDPVVTEFVGRASAEKAAA